MVNNAIMKNLEEKLLESLSDSTYLQGLI